MQKDPRRKFRAWRARYGDVFSLYLAGQLVVVLNGYDVIKEALVKMADAFSNRPILLTLEKIDQHRGKGSLSLWLCFSFFCPEHDFIPHQHPKTINTFF
jgi:hypothetical protein